MNIPNPYASKHYKLLILIPVILILISLFFIPHIPKGIDLQGGQLITIITDDPITAPELQLKLAELHPSSVRAFQTPIGRGFEIELPVDDKFASAESKVSEMNALYDRLVKAQVSGAPEALQLEQETLSKAREAMAIISPSAAVDGDVRKAVESVRHALSDEKSAQRAQVTNKINSVVSVRESSFKEVGSSLSKFFFAKTQEVILYAFLLSGIIVFIVFRSVVPSLAIIFGAAADIIITAGLMGVFGIPLSLASVAALLMLIGFSLDTDILIATRVLKHKEGTPEQRGFEAMKTAVTMNMNVVAAFAVLTAVAFYLQIPVYEHIGLVVVIGGIVDFITTASANPPIHIWHVKRMEKK